MFSSRVALAARTLRSEAVPGYGHFVTPLRRLVVDYDDRLPSSAGLRKYLEKGLLKMARENPDVEVVVRNLGKAKSSVLRGHYVNGRDKVICVDGLEVNQIEHKITLLLTSSGAKIKPLKNLTLEAAPGGEAARGIWSAIHDQSKPGGGYTI